MAKKGEDYYEDENRESQCGLFIAKGKKIQGVILQLTSNDKLFQVAYNQVDTLK